MGVTLRLVDGSRIEDWRPSRRDAPCGQPCGMLHSIDDHFWEFDHVPDHILEPPLD